MAGLGLDAAIIADAPDNLKKRVGWAAYVVSTLKSLNHPFVRIELKRRRRAVDPNGWFRSVTKTFTATVVLSLVADGLVDLEHTCEHWLPGLVPSGHGITMRQLLNHTSGLYNYTDDLPDPAGILWARFNHWEPQLFAPGADWSYSNTNYALLGLVIEAATGNSYGAEVRARVLEPLDLRTPTATSSSTIALKTSPPCSPASYSRRLSSRRC